MLVPPREAAPDLMHPRFESCEKINVEASMVIESDKEGGSGVDRNKEGGGGVDRNKQGGGGVEIRHGRGTSIYGCRDESKDDAGA